MPGVGPDEGGGRRLPQWMTGASVTPQLEKSDKTIPKRKSGLSSQASVLDPNPKKTRRRKDRLLVEEDSLSLKSSGILTKCGTKRRKGKEKCEEDDSNFSVSGDFVPEKKCNRPRRKLRENSASRESNAAPEIQALSENDDEDVEELTAEDLVTIAKEFVGENKTTDQDRASERNHEQRERSTDITLSRNDYEHNNEGARIRRETTTRNDTSTSTVFSKSETSVSSSGTGDPAQDMLDLFLGPLLKKPLNETKSDFLSDDVASSRDFEIRNKTDVVKDELVPQVTKKKSSLKDKIAMFI